MKKTRKILGLLLAALMVLSVLPAFAENTGNTTNGEYANGIWGISSTSTGTKSYGDGKYELSKTAQENNDGTFTINLGVKVTPTSTTTAQDSAVVLVLDLSNSMKDGSRLKTLKQVLNGYHENPGFLDELHDSAKGAKRMVSIVTFGDNGAIVQNWIDIAIDKNLNTVKSIIGALETSGGTNLDAGLHAAYDQLGESAVAAIQQKDVIVLADGEPTYHNHIFKNNEIGFADMPVRPVRPMYRDYAGRGAYLEAMREYYEAMGEYYKALERWLSGQRETGSGEITGDWADGYENKGGTGYETDNKTRLATELGAVKLKEKVAESPNKGKVYSVDFSGEAEIMPIMSYLANEGCAYRASNASRLEKAFKEILAATTQNTWPNSMVVTDPMSEHVTLVEAVGDAKQLETDDNSEAKVENNIITWTLTTPPNVEDDSLPYTYTLSYKVTLNEKSKDGSFHPTNDPTYLTVDGVQLAFPVPGVKGVVPVPTTISITVNKVWKDRSTVPVNSNWPEGATATVTLYADNVATNKTIVLSSDNQSSTFENLPIKNAAGAAITYTVKEVAVEGYTSAVTGNMTDGFTVTNTKNEPDPGPTPDLIIKKIVNGNDCNRSTQAFDFRLTLTCPPTPSYEPKIMAKAVRENNDTDGNDQDGLPYIIVYNKENSKLGDPLELKTTNGVWSVEFKLGHGERAELYMPDEFWDGFGYTVEETDSHGHTYIAENDEGTIGGDSNRVTFTNTKNGGGHHHNDDPVVYPPIVTIPPKTGDKPLFAWLVDLFR